jgi:hypothetical protein
MENSPVRNPSRRGSTSGRLWLASAVAVCAAYPVLAAGNDSGRYTMSPAEGGVIRLDRETGAMAFCSGKEDAWTCKDMPESESALKKRVEELEAEKRALEAEKQLRAGPPPGAGPLAKAPEPSVPPPSAEATPPPPPGDLPMPTEKDVDKLFDYVEGMVKKFKERIDRLEKEAQKEPGTQL